MRAALFRTNWRRSSLLIALVLSPDFARGNPCDAVLGTIVAPGEHPTPEAAISELQAEHGRQGNVLAVQGDFDCVIRDGGGGACASATAFNLLQIMRRMTGVEGTLAPHATILAAFKAQPGLLDGRVTNLQMENLLHYYRRYLPGKDFGLNHAPIDSASAPDLAVHPAEIKMLTYHVKPNGGPSIGRHFVVIKKFQDGLLTVTEPGQPLKDLTFELARDPRAKSGWRLVRPKGAPASHAVFDLDSRFTVKLKGTSGPSPRPATPPGPEQVNAHVDATVNAFRGTKNFVSPRAWRKQGAKYGLPGLDLPRELGGGAWKPSQMVKVFEHAGEYDLNLRDVVGGAHVRPLLASDTPEVHDIVRQVGQGKGYVAIAITEPEAGSNMRAMKSQATPVAGGYQLSGTKRYNARFSQASHVVVFTQAPGQEAGKLNAFVLPIDYPGLKFQKMNAQGLHGNSFGGVSFDQLFVPEKYRLGKDGEGGKIFREHFVYWRLMQTSAAIGTGKGALRQMAERIRSRQAFGGPIGRFTHLQQELAENTGKLEMASSLVEKAAKLLDEGRYAEAEPLVAMAKAEGVEFALRAADDAMKAFGAEGYTDGVDLAQRKRDLEGLRIADGTTDVMRQDVVRKVYGEDFWRMAMGLEEP